MTEEALGAWYRAWEDVKRDVIQNAFDDISQSYQDILIRGHLMPNRFVERDIAEAEFGLDNKEYDYYLDQSNKDTPDPEPEDLEPWS